MKTAPYILVAIISILIATPPAAGGEYPFGNGFNGNQPDTIEVITAKEAAKKRNVFQKVYRYFANSDGATDKKFDISFIGGPHYTSDTKLGVALAVAGTYSTNSGDPLTPISNIALYSDITTTGFYLFGIRGNNIFTRDKWRIEYTLYFYSLPGTFWGIGFNNGNNSSNCSDYLRLQAQATADFIFRITDNISIGPTASFKFASGKNFSERGASLLGDLERITRYSSLGLMLSYDSRDFAYNASKGVYAKLLQKGYTDFKGKPFWGTYLTLDYYRRLWEDAVLAFDLYGELQYGDVPWTMKSELGGSHRMRGYYQGRYRDDNSLSLQTEYRQKIYKRHGIAVWAGCGTVWGKESPFSWKHILPNYGIGYRWEFKNRMNVRIDYGFGKNGQNSFLFSICEAF